MKKKIIAFAVTVTMVLSVFLIVPATVNADASQFIHPGILHTKQDLDLMREKVLQKAEPWLSGFNVLSNDPGSSADYVMNPQETVVREGYARAPEIEADSSAAYQIALMWAITKNTVYRDKAIQILNGWANTCQAITGKDAQLAASTCGFKFANAAEIMRYTDSGWSAGDISKFESWLLNKVYPHCLSTGAPTQMLDGNWGTGSLKAQIAIAVFCNDRTKFDLAVSIYKGEGPSDTIGASVVRNILNKSHGIYAGEHSETGRDQSHTQLGLAHLAETAQVAYSQGYDLYSFADNLLLTGYEYTAKYNLGFDVPYTPFGTVGHGDYPEISTQDRGDFRPVYEIVYNHYVKLKEIPAPYTEMAVNRIFPEGKSQFADCAGFGTLLFTKEYKTDLPNFAANKTVTASSSVNQWGWGSEKATDGNRNSVDGALGWTSDNSPFVDHSEYVIVDLETAKQVGRVDLYPVNTQKHLGFTFPIDFTIDVSADGANWNTVVIRTNYKVSANYVQSFMFECQTARYIRVNGTHLCCNPNDSNTYRMQFAEIEAYGANLCVNGFGTQVEPTSSLEYNRWGLDKLTDGQKDSLEITSGWTSNNQTGENHGEALVFDLQQPCVVGDVKIYPRNDRNNVGEGFPIAFNIFYSNDNVNFTRVVSKYDYPKPFNEVQDFTFANVTARYIKIQGTNLRVNLSDGNSFRMQFAEVGIYSAPYDNSAETYLIDENRLMLSDCDDAAKWTADLTNNTVSHSSDVIQGTGSLSVYGNSISSGMGDDSTCSRATLKYNSPVDLSMYEYLSFEFYNNPKFEEQSGLVEIVLNSGDGSTNRATYSFEDLKIGWHRVVVDRNDLVSTNETDLSNIVSISFAWHNYCNRRDNITFYIDEIYMGKYIHTTVADSDDGDPTDGYSYYCGPVTLYANPKPDNTFLHWENKEGVTVSTEADWTIPVVTASNEYRAVYYSPEANAPIVNSVNNLTLPYNYQGENRISLNVTPGEGTPELSYKWVESDFFGTIGQVVSTDEAYEIPLGKAAGTHYYRCYVTGTRLNGKSAETLSGRVSVTVEDPIYYNVNFVTNGGSIVSGGFDRYIYGQETTLPTDVKMNNNLFVGWFDNEQLSGQKVLSISSDDSGDKTFYAKWALYGDISLNGVTDVYDSLLTLRSSLYMYTPDELQAKVCDVDLDGEITSVDAMIILQYSIELIKSLPVDIR